MGETVCGFVPGEGLVCSPCIVANGMERHADPLSWLDVIERGEPIGKGSPACVHCGETIDRDPVTGDPLM